MLTATSGFNLHFWIPHAAFLFSLALVSTGCSANEEEPDLSPAESFEQRQLNSPLPRTWTSATVSIFVLERVVEEKGIDEIVMGNGKTPSVTPRTETETTKYGQPTSNSSKKENSSLQRTENIA